MNAIRTVWWNTVDPNNITAQELVDLHKDKNLTLEEAELLLRKDTTSPLDPETEELMRSAVRKIDELSSIF